MKINEFINESTTAGSIATVAAPMTTQKRNNIGKGVYGNEKPGTLLTGKKTNKKYANSVNESKMKQVAMDLEHMQDGNFKQKYGKSKDQIKFLLGDPKSNKTVHEATLEEDDVILVPGQGHRLKTGFHAFDPDKAEHEGETLKNSLRTIARNAKELHSRLEDSEQFPEWVSEKIGQIKGMMTGVTEYLISSQKHNNTVTDGIFNYWAYEPNVNEGVIVGHDANDPEIAILGGAGTMSLSRLKKKAHQEALQLADDIANGKYNASSYNMKQLHNTLNTIVAAEKEMEKSYFGENAWNQLGQRKPNTNLPAPERGSRVNHGRRFEEGDIVLPLSGPLKGQPHKVIHSQRTVIRIVPLTGTYPGDTIAPRTKHEWVVPADINEDYTGEFAAEKTPAVNPHCGQKDLQFRGAISETPTDNPTGTSTEGGWRNYKPKSAGTHNESSILKGLKRESK